MANLNITDIIEVGMTAPHIATDWQVAYDSSFEAIVDESIKDEENLLKWITPLYKENGEMYKGDEVLYARARVYYEGKDTPSPWYVFLTCEGNK